MIINDISMKERQLQVIISLWALDWIVFVWWNTNVSSPEFIGKYVRALLIRFLPPCSWMSTCSDLLKRRCLHVQRCMHVHVCLYIHSYSLRFAYVFRFAYIFRYVDMFRFAYKFRFAYMFRLLTYSDLLTCSNLPAYSGLSTCSDLHLHVQICVYMSTFATTCWDSYRFRFVDMFRFA